MIFVRCLHKHSGTERWFHVINGDELEMSNGMSFWVLDEFKIMEIQEYDSWMKLYIETNFCDLEVKPTESMDIWISPFGMACYGEPYFEYAPDIVNIFYKNEPRVYDENAVDVLRRLGWINTQLDIDNTSTEATQLAVSKHQKATLLKWAEANKVNLSNINFVESSKPLDYKGVYV